ncbi:MAG: type II toxin-antitoxin system RelE/ParE family toxin [Chitinophagaceae bacterium]|nr:type II toxin-antitoxin system RelE/ParE family toxin [Chitinophagaceae bacterium]
MPKNVVFTLEALDDINNIITYLKLEWGESVCQSFLFKLTSVRNIISEHPRIFSYHNKRKNIRKVAFAANRVLYYRNRRNIIEIMVVFDTRQNPRKLKSLLKNRIK